MPNLAGLSIRLKSWQSRLGLKRRRWKHYGALHHLWFFTPATLAALVEAAGFRVVHWETPAEDRPGRFGWAKALVRGPLEAARMGGILDLYARPAEPTREETRTSGLDSTKPRVGPCRRDPRGNLRAFEFGPPAADQCEP